jgi:hypothetical protein
VSVIVLGSHYIDLTTHMWRYDDICKGETECFFKAMVRSPIPKSSIGFIYLKGFSQADMK